MNKSIKTLLQNGIDFATKDLKCDEVVIAYNVGTQKRLVVENKDFSLANSLEKNRVSVVVHKQQKMGSASINTLNASDLKTAIEAAVTIASFSVPDPALTIANAKQAAPAKAIQKMFDKRLLNFDLLHLQESMRKGLRILLADQRVALERFEMSLDTGEHGLMNSKGVQQSEETTALHWDYLGMAKEKDEVSGMDYDSNFSYQQDDYEALMLRDVEIFTQRVVENLHPISCPSYKGKVVLSPRACEELILSTIFYHASGSQVMDGKSKWADAVGKKVAHKNLTILDHPLDPRFSGATAFDADGLPTKAQTLIEKGELKMHLFDCYSAKRCKTDSNAMAGGPFAVEIAGAGDHNKATLADLYASQKSLLYVDRFSGNVDPLTGDFSGVVKCSSLYASGKRVGAVGETMIAGNVFTMLNNIVAVSSEQELVSGQYLSPHLLVDGISVSG